MVGIGLLDRVKGIEQRFNELEQRLNDPSVVANTREYAQLARERSQLQEVAGVVREYRRQLDELDEHREILEGDDADDAELRELARAELPALQRNQARLEERLKDLLTARDPNDDRNVLLEIRAGTGGEEASLLATDLFRMY